MTGVTDDTIIGTIVTPSGLTLAKVIPAGRATAFADPGLGASPTWHGFAIDRTGIAFTDAISVIGDQRVRRFFDAGSMRGAACAACNLQKSIPVRSWKTQLGSDFQIRILIAFQFSIDSILIHW